MASNRPQRKRAARLARATQPVGAAVKKRDFHGQPHWLEARLIVPAIYLDSQLTSGVDDVALRYGPGVDENSPEPGEKGNSVVAAHRNVWGAEFWHLPRLKKGDLIEVLTPRRRLIFRVRSSALVGEHDLAPLQAPRDPSVSRLTLYTCTKPRTAKRYIVSADLESSLPSSPEVFEERQLPSAVPRPNVTP
jgi:sortase A